MTVNEDEEEGICMPDPLFKNLWRHTGQTFAALHALACFRDSTVSNLSTDYKVDNQFVLLLEASHRCQTGSAP